MKNIFIQRIYDAPIDIIGDIHGEIDALQNLIQILGYDRDGNHNENRKLIFVGDLCDRGLDSVAVIKLVKHLVDNGNAQCVLGNHELNILIHSKREGNGWFFGSPHEDDDKKFNSKEASLHDREMIIRFLSTLPLVLESEKIRVVHACWDNASIASLMKDKSKSVKEAYDLFTKRIEEHLTKSGIAQKARKEELGYEFQLKDIYSKVPFLKNLAHKHVVEQMNNPVKVVTSGTEAFADDMFFAGGKWRMVKRLKWWDQYESDIPVVVGHYWRNFNKGEKKRDLFQHIDPLHWFGAKKNVFCIDYSVGKRYEDRQHQREFSNKLVALRFPENYLVQEDGIILKIKNTLNDHLG